MNVVEFLREGVNHDQFYGVRFTPHIPLHEFFGLGLRSLEPLKQPISRRRNDRPSF